MIDKTDLIETILYKYAQGVTFNNASKGEAINITDLKPMIDLFVEQACEAIDSVTTNSKAPGFNNGYDNCKEKVKQAIMDKFK